MAVKTGGSLSIGEIQNEFGGGYPAPLTRFYRGAGYVPNGPAVNNNIPTGGTISVGRFYSSTKTTGFVFNRYIQQHLANYDVRNDAVAWGWNQVDPLIATITLAGGYWIYGSSTGNYAFYSSYNFPAGSSIELINNGYIVGCGGAGGSAAGLVFGDANQPQNNAFPGGGGGHGLVVSYPMRVTNYGIIAGGGGGGGGGGNGSSISGDPKFPVGTFYGGGGGGGGRSGLQNSGGGAGGYVTTGYGYSGGNGGAGSSGGAGGGGPRGSDASGYGGNGGNGGDWGQNGGGGGTGPGANAVGSGGGPSGYAVSGSGYVTWAVAGARYGPIG